MRKSLYVVLVIFAILPVLSCKSQSEKGKEDSKNVQSAEVQIEHLTASTFREKVFDYQQKEYKFLGDKPCIIDFYASWCGPCKMLAPTMQSAANQYNGKITIYKVDVDAQQDLAAAFGISGIPTILFCPKNAKPQITSGLLSKTDLDKAINELLLQ